MVSVVLSEATRNISIAPGLGASPSEGLPQYLIRRWLSIHQASVVQTLDSTIHRINHYPEDKN